MKKILIVLTGIAALFLLFISVYVIWPQFERTSLLLPASCNGSYEGSVGSLAYTLPDTDGTGILVAQGDGAAVVAVVATTTPHTSEVYLLDTADNRIVRTLYFPTDAVMAAIYGGVVYLYNDKTGYFLNAHTGLPEKSIVRIDNYGGLSSSDRPVFMQASGDSWYVETSAIISSWDANGSILLGLHLSMNAISRGCFVNGATGEITKL